MSVPRCRAFRFDLPPLGTLSARVQLSGDFCTARTDTLDVEPSAHLERLVLAMCAPHTAELLADLRRRDAVDWRVRVNTSRLRLSRPVAEMLDGAPERLPAGAVYDAEICPVYYRRRERAQTEWRIFLELRVLRPPGGVAAHAEWSAAQMGVQLALRRLGDAEAAYAEAILREQRARARVLQLWPPHAKDDGAASADST